MLKFLKRFLLVTLRSKRKCCTSCACIRSTRVCWLLIDLSVVASFMYIFVLWCLVQAVVVSEVYVFTTLTFARNCSSSSNGFVIVCSGEF